jgi:hypothetical protein
LPTLCDQLRDLRFDADITRLDQVLGYAIELRLKSE